MGLEYVRPTRKPTRKLNRVLLSDVSNTTKDAQDSKVKFDTKHNGAGSATCNVLSAVKNTPVACVPQAQNIAARRYRRTRPVQIQGQDRRAQPPRDSEAICSGNVGYGSIAWRAASTAERQRHHIQSRASASMEVSKGRFPREGPSKSHTGQS